MYQNLNYVETNFQSADAPHADGWPPAPPLHTKRCRIPGCRLCGAATADIHIRTCGKCLDKFQQAADAGQELDGVALGIALEAVG